ncbi:GtrA family protein [Terrisporobacter glycolicus]|uniref:GtrA/DPMS transmembrane domain-containing protein n=1 Tax=Terrisporobacter glycolicus ATCC 14880 = DSM 1288 TaxID=1121315 RepID=A0ABZ2EZU3_9FIRM|nr:GtrA family protein [Terrisporobacter glycolicus]
MLAIKNTIVEKFKLYKDKIMEYIKFNIIGTANFIVAQIFYLTLYLVFKIHYLVAYTITSVISITASYYLNSRFTFKEQKYSFKKYLLSFLVYIFEYALNLGVILLLVNIFGLSKAIAPIIAPVFSTIPVFFLMRLVIKHTDEKK